MPDFPRLFRRHLPLRLPVALHLSCGCRSHARDTVRDHTRMNCASGLGHGSRLWWVAATSTIGLPFVRNPLYFERQENVLREHEDDDVTQCWWGVANYGLASPPEYCEAEVEGGDTYCPRHQKLLDRMDAWEAANPTEEEA